jgi:glycine/D-amino acid oxidase-like deaminating enzyme
MDRRTLLKTGSLAALGLSLGGCATGSGRGQGPHSRRLTPVQVTWDRVIRTTVGLRPHRPSGFVVRTERIDDKTVVHNYGHGGAGMSLSWGTALLAAELATAHTERTAAVIGCGAAGLTTARQLQRRGFRVTIYAKEVPPHTTSNMSLAGWTPLSGLVSGGSRPPEWDAQFRRAAEAAYRELQILVGRGYGVSWIDFYTMVGDEPPSAAERSEASGTLLPASLQTGTELLGPGEHEFPLDYVRRGPTLRIEPSVYLDALVRDVLLFGGDIVHRSFETRRDLASLDESLILNCTGLGARDLFDDEELIPVKGQLVVLVPQEDVRYGTLGGMRPGRGFPIHMQPRRDGIALGGTAERGDWSLEPDEEARRRVVEEHMELFREMAER